ncbi:hypothetical protein NQ317_009156, partial [Molorchus minor]
MRLNEQMHEKSLLENKLKKSQDKEISAARKLERSEKQHEEFKAKLGEAEAVIRELSDQVNKLEKDYEKMREYEEEIARLNGVVDHNHKTVKDLENRNTYLQMETKFLEDYRKEVEQMKRTIDRMQNDERVGQLESQLAEERAKCMELKQKLQESENTQTENQELRELRLKYWRLEKELDNSKIDNRILERELKDAQSELKLANNKIEDLNKTLVENRRAHEAALLELSNINEEVSMELLKTKDGYKNLQDKLNIEKEKLDLEKKALVELERTVNSKEKITSALSKEIGDLKRDKSILENEMQKSENEKSRLMGLVEQLQKEKSDVYHELQKTRREMKNTNLIDELSSKKRTLTEVIFGSSKKENQPPSSIVMNYKDLEAQLFKERQSKKQLQEELFKIKASTSIGENRKVLDKINTARLDRHKSEILSPKSKIAMQQIVNSPGNQKNDAYQRGSEQRMHHNIPHRFDSKLCTKPMKCASCSVAISLGRSVNVCKECSL